QHHFTHWRYLRWVDFAGVGTLFTLLMSNSAGQSSTFSTSRYYKNPNHDNNQFEPKLQPALQNLKTEFLLFRQNGNSDPENAERQHSVCALVDWIPCIGHWLYCNHLCSVQFDLYVNFDPVDWYW